MVQILLTKQNELRIKAPQKKPLPQPKAAFNQSQSAVYFSISTLILLFLTSTIPPSMSNSCSLWSALSSTIRIWPLPKADTIGAWLFSILNAPTTPGTLTSSTGKCHLVRTDKILFYSIIIFLTVTESVVSKSSWSVSKPFNIFTVCFNLYDFKTLSTTSISNTSLSSQIVSPIYELK